MKDDQFDKLFGYMQDFRSDVKGEFESTNRRIDHLTGAVDDFAGEIKDNREEQAARDLQFERLLAWARKVSEKTGIPLEGF